MFRKDSFLDRLNTAFVGPRQERAAGYEFPSLYPYGKPHSFKPQESIKAYGDNPYLYPAINKICQQIARTKFHLQIEHDDELEIIREHQALETLKRPWPTEGGKTQMTGMALKFRTAQHLMLNGEAFWVLDRRLKMSGAPTKIRMLQPAQVVVETGTNGDISEYVFRPGTTQMRFDPLDVVHFKLPDPEDVLRGHSPVKSVRYSIDSYKEADNLNRSLLKNGAQPGGFLKTTERVADEERKKFGEAWQSKYGGGANAGKTPFLPYGIDFAPSQQSNRDMQFTEGKNVNRDEILANFGVGKEILGQTDNQTRANAEAAFFAFMQFGVLFFIEIFADTLTTDYLVAFPHDEGMAFGFPDPVPQNMEEKRLNMQAAFAMGAVSPNQVRKEFGWEPDEREGMDDYYVPISVSPVGEDPVAPNEPADQPINPDPSDEEPADATDE